MEYLYQPNKFIKSHLVESYYKFKKKIKQSLNSALLCFFFFIIIIIIWRSNILKPKNLNKIFSNTIKKGK